MMANLIHLTELKKIRYNSKKRNKQFKNEVHITLSKVLKHFLYLGKLMQISKSDFLASRL